VILALQVPSAGCLSSGVMRNRELIAIPLACAVARAAQDHPLYLETTYRNARNRVTWNMK